MVDLHGLHAGTAGRSKMGGQGEENVAAVVAHPAQFGEVVHVAVAERSVLEFESAAVDHVQVLELSGNFRNLKHGHLDTKRKNSLGPSPSACDFSIPASAFESV